METPEPTIVPAGTIIGERYEIESLLGRGGMAAVYRARDTQLGRSVAVKLFRADAEGAGGAGRETSEIRLLASLNHHALVTLYDAVIAAEEGDEPTYLVMELVEGATLRDRIAAGPVSEADIALLVIDIAEALHVVHAGGVVHRDIKPANILLAPSAMPAVEFRAKLSDFGIAYLIDSTRLTTPGTIVGTAAFLSPEQARGEAAGSPADIYSLGLVVRETLTGERAFPGSMIESLSARLVNDPVIPASVGDDWRMLLADMTAREPGARPTALEVAERARAIERTLHVGPEVGTVSGTVSGADAELTVGTAAVAGTGAPGSIDATAVLEPSVGTREFTAPTTALTADDVPTRVMPTPESGTPTRATEVLEPRSAPAPVTGSPRIERRIPRRAVRVAAGAVVVLAIAGIGVGIAVATSGGDEPAAAPTIVPNDGELGDHLDQLLESVTP